MICDKCYCDDTEENPLFEILDDSGFVEERICMMCYLEEIDNGTFS